VILIGHISCKLSGFFLASFQRPGRYRPRTDDGSRKLCISHSIVHVTVSFHLIVLDVVILMLFVAE